MQQKSFKWGRLLDKEEVQTILRVLQG